MNISTRDSCDAFQLSRSHVHIPAITWPYIAAELLIALLAIAGNFLVCLAVNRNRKLRTVTNYFLVSLAVADIFVGVLAIPCAVLIDLGYPRHNLPLCLLLLSVLIVLTQSSILSLLAVAAERYVAILLPLQYQRIVSPSESKSKSRGPVKARCGSGGSEYKRAVRMRREVRKATSLFLVLFMFILCWLPLHILNCVTLMCPRCHVPLPLSLAAILLSHANSALNPLLYAYRMRSFRHTLRALCCTHTA
ncbi:adenosine receptor A2a-like [Salvelinus namaycush]|uniref:Adenosine receptor A2a-like n=1 Tax=Salvelinus namaycush TaxID=8040 RepID=A0A8U0PE89_SALNM|nr:adenosine receptor A2a-like [Salvelinus namaycush]